ncbi:GGDEF domain-containing protein [Vibrio methylphosphonaticus]|uniref:GGDEF domain-containing protein n=1 Tax=Vibrio methylphosphonaticus TaxID=2946866 RepID=UPI00202ABC53|nr:GGDEF domain-containing protein [Vibrio methylphosphonaticus]MCL9776160.1 GGDEF domain-containing protein [Vibrio methylphosphonaticus]
MFSFLHLTKTLPFQVLRYRLFIDTQIYQPYSRFMYGAIAVFLLFSITDFLVLQHHGFIIIAARFTLAIVATLCLYFASRHHWRGLPLLEVGLFIGAGLIVQYSGIIALHIGNTNYQSGGILLMLYIGTFSRLSFSYSVIAIVGIALPYILYLHPELVRLSEAKEYNHYMIVLSTAVFCILGSYRRELETKTRFRESQQIRSQSIRLSAYSKRQKNLSETDALTQINNRHYLNLWVSQEEHLPSPFNLAFVMLDIDRFKQVNDNYGHDVGDKVIKQVASVLLANKPKGGQLIRYGGEEFLLIFPATNIKTLACDVESIRKKCSEITAQKNVLVTVSAGAYLANSQNDTILSAINYADKGLYQAKQSGRNKTVIPQLLDTP